MGPLPRLRHRHRHRHEHKHKHKHKHTLAHAVAMTALRPTCHAGGWVKARLLALARMSIGRSDTGGGVWLLVLLLAPPPVQAAPATTRWVPERRMAVTRLSPRLPRPCRPPLCAHTRCLTFWQRRAASMARAVRLVQHGCHHVPRVWVVVVRASNRLTWLARQATWLPRLRAGLCSMTVPSAIAVVVAVMAAVAVAVAVVSRKWWRSG